MNIPILMYHKILPSIEGDSTTLVVAESNFDKQMSCMKSEGYTSILLRDLADAVKNKTKLPEKPFVITFDDALVPVEKYAVPILDKYGFKAVVFVVPAAIGKYNNWDEGKPVARVDVMTLPALKKISSMGWEIGSHTLTHAELQTVTPEKLKEETAGSKKVLEDLFNTKITSFCYPYGGINSVVKQAVIDAGYTAACAISARTRSVTEDMFELKRVYVMPKDSLFTFKRRIAQWYLLLRGIRKR